MYAIYGNMDPMGHKTMTSSLKAHFIYIYIYTSSTAQGGGGSFKNRKPIGELGGCE